MMGCVLGVLLSQAPFHFEVPGELERTEPTTTVVMGYPVELWAARSSRPPVELLEHFARAMVAAGLYVPPPARQPRLARDVHLTGLDPERLVAYTVLLKPRRDRGTAVVMTVASLRQQPPQPGAAPCFPGGSPPVVSALEGGQLTAYSVRGVAADEVAGWYRAGLAAEGWHETAPLTFRRGVAERTLQLGPPRAGALPVVVLDRAAAE